MKIYNFARCNFRVLKNKIKNIIRRQSDNSSNNFQDQEDTKSLPYTLELVPTKQNTKIIGSNWLASFKGNQQSEHGEDGIISKIFEIMKPENKWVCEFGAHDPEIISNTWRLINQENWNAVLIEGDPGYAQKLSTYYKGKPSVHCLNRLVSFEGLEKLDNILKATPAPTNLDFMVIDIDGNDYHVWEAIENYRAKVVMIEFNASIPIDVTFVQPKNLSVNQGNSLKAMTELASRKGYKLIAVTSWNAFFVLDEYFHLFFTEQPLLEDMYVYPAKHPIWMRPFQLYDGTIIVAPWNEMLWHKVNLTENDCQVLPISLRNFSRELTSKDYVIENSREKTSTDNEILIHLQKIYEMPKNILSKYAKNIFSRYGEDGIIECILPTLDIQAPFFVEIGAGDGVTYSRSRNLVANHYWSGLQVESNIEWFKRLQSNRISKEVINHYGPYSLLGEHHLDSVFKKYKAPKEIDVLLINVYGMEYYLWESITQFFPKLVLVQFNPTVPNDVKFIQSKDFNIHQGVSLKALCDLANYKDYELVAVTLETAFFVRRRYLYRIFELYGLQHADIDEMYCPLSMKWFQLYDGTIASQGLDRLMWHGIRIDQDRLQVIPQSLRKFHQFADQDNKKHFYRV